VELAGLVVVDIVFTKTLTWVVETAADLTV
jgi:hypothetical protein